MLSFLLYFLLSITVICKNGNNDLTGLADLHEKKSLLVDHVNKIQTSLEDHIDYSQLSGSDLVKTGA